VPTGQTCDLLDNDCDGRVDEVGVVLEQVRLSEVVGAVAASVARGDRGVALITLEQDLRGVEPGRGVVGPLTLRGRAWDDDVDEVETDRFLPNEETRPVFSVSAADPEAFPRGYLLMVASGPLMRAIHYDRDLDRASTRGIGPVVDVTRPAAVAQGAVFGAWADDSQLWAVRYGSQQTALALRRAEPVLGHVAMADVPGAGGERALLTWIAGAPDVGGALRGIELRQVGAEGVAAEGERVLSQVGASPSAPATAEIETLAVREGGDSARGERDDVVVVAWADGDPPTLHAIPVQASVEPLGVLPSRALPPTPVRWLRALAVDERVALVWATDAGGVHLAFAGDDGEIQTVREPGMPLVAFDASAHDGQMAFTWVDEAGQVELVVGTLRCDGP
jgi:hypothetical protein